jgi:glycosyltransferase 2 family protein
VTAESGFTPHQLLVVLGILLGVSVSGLVASFIISGFNLFHLLPHKFPGRDKLIEIAAAYHLYARHWIATFFAFAASLVAHLATFATFLFVAYALHAEDVRKTPPAPVPAVDFFAVMPIERTITAVPISLAGIGLREKLLQVMLNNICGVTVEKAKLIGSLGFLVIMICCAPGGIVYFLYKPSGVVKRVKLRNDGGRKNHHAKFFTGRFHLARRQAAFVSAARYGRRCPGRPQHAQAGQRPAWFATG